MLAISHVEPRNVGIVLEKLRAGLAREKFEWQGRRVQISASFGIAGFFGGAAPGLQELLAQAEKALHCAKQTAGPRARKNETEQEAQLRSG